MKISVVTVHLNDFEGLGRTFETLGERPESGVFEWIVVDGGSAWDRKDEALMEQVRNKANVFISEPDGGIYDAMNKGTGHATSEYVLYLNAGDEIHQEFDVDRLHEEIGDDRPAMIWGTCNERFPNGQIVKVKNRSARLSWYGMPVNHQNVLFRRNVLGDEPYDTRFESMADYELIGRLLKQGEDVRHTTIPIAIFYRGGLHSINLSKTLDEEAEIRTLHFGVPRLLSSGIKLVKHANARIGRVPAMRRIMRRWV